MKTEELLAIVFLGLTMVGCSMIRGCAEEGDKVPSSNPNYQIETPTPSANPSPSIEVNTV